MKILVVLILVFIVFLGITFFLPSLFIFNQTCSGSSIQGTITQNGAPLARIKVKRLTNWQREVESETITKDDGSFTLPAQYGFSFMKWLPFEYVSLNRITLEHQGKTYMLMEYNKREQEENSERKGKAITVTCDLNNSEEVGHFNERVSFFGICPLVD